VLNYTSCCTVVIKVITSWSCNYFKTFLFIAVFSENNSCTDDNFFHRSVWITWFCFLLLRLQSYLTVLCASGGQFNILGHIVKSFLWTTLCYWFQACACLRLWWWLRFKMFFLFRNALKWFFCKSFLKLAQHLKIYSQNRGGMMRRE